MHACRLVNASMQSVGLNMQDFAMSSCLIEGYVAMLRYQPARRRLIRTSPR